MTTTLHFHLQSYGGYMAGMVGSSETGIYSTAISQSPVTDWHYYGIENYCTTYDSIENEKHHIAVYSDELYMIHSFADSIYTERYMVTPDENEQGYKVSILLYHDNKNSNDFTENYPYHRTHRCCIELATCLMWTIYSFMALEMVDHENLGFAPLVIISLSLQTMFTSRTLPS